MPRPLRCSLVLAAIVLAGCTVRYGDPLPSGTPAAAVPWLDAREYPFESRFLEVPGGELHYVDEGPREAPTVLLVHGTPTWSFLYRNVIRELAADHRCIAPDHIGFGLSSKPQAGFAYTPEAHAANLVRLLDALDLRDVTLVVHDLGGPIGLGAALQRSDRIGRIVAINTFAWSLEEDTNVQRIDSVLRTSVGRWLYEKRNLSPEWLLPSAFGEDFELSDHVHRHYTHPFADETTRAGLYRIGLALRGASSHYASLWSRAAELEPKVRLLIFGLQDPTFGPEVFETWKARFPEARSVALERVGHFPQEEAPSEVAGAIRELGRAGAKHVRRDPDAARPRPREPRPEADPVGAAAE